MTDEELQPLVAAYMRTRSVTLAGKAIGVSRSVASNRIQLARRRGLMVVRDTDMDGPLNINTPRRGKSGRLTELGRRLLAKRPKTWFDDLDADEQGFLADVRTNYGKKLYRIRVQDLLAEIKAEMPTLTVGSDRFKRWLDGQDA